MIPFSMIDNVDTTLTPYARKDRINIYYVILTITKYLRLRNT